MQVLNTPAIAANPTTPTAPTPTAANSSSSITNPNAPGSLTNESTFLQLLMAQVQNQDPMNPTDSTQFVGQLVSFSQLEQLLSINQGVQSLVTDATPTSTPATPATPTTPTSPTSTPASLPATISTKTNNPVLQ
jgi:flagellar basal-body rod modification protein FlgD